MRADAAASGQDTDAAVEAACLRGPQPSPKGVVVLAKASSLRELYAKVRQSKEAVKRDVIMVLIRHGIEDERNAREFLGPGEDEGEGEGEFDLSLAWQTVRDLLHGHRRPT